MAPNKANESSRSFEGVGRVLRAAGGGIGRRGLEPLRPDAFEYAPDAVEKALGP
jgi:hypothetical protein